MCACVLVLAAWAAGAALAKTAAPAEPSNHWRRLSAEVEARVEMGVGVGVAVVVGFVAMLSPLAEEASWQLETQTA
jgi:hypothetical protein